VTIRDHESERRAAIRDTYRRVGRDVQRPLRELHTTNGFNNSLPSSELLVRKAFEFLSMCE